MPVLNVAGRNRVLKQPRARSLSAEYTKGLDKRHKSSTNASLPALDSDSQVQTLLLQCLESFHTLAYMQYKTPKLLETHLFPHSQAHEVLQGAFFKLSFAVKTDNIYQQQWSTKALKSTHSLLP